ncbi:MAG: 3-phosphoshikimate 1-carboxyvinyltransferase [Bacteroidetes bacterium]|nr:MAG: 3-phosphoshikimate 1-carboxyvinyltransferase [Bacteroidota bacterium]
MQVIIQPGTVQGHILAPASKSSMQRACAASLLAKGETIIVNPGHSNDDRAALGVIRDLGAQIEENTDGSLRVFSHGVDPISDRVNCGESGLGIRMFAPIVALSKKSMSIVGDGSLLNRPMDFFDEVFPLLGIDLNSNHGKLPLRLKGPLKPANITIDGSLSSQFLTGLLMAFAASGAKDITVNVRNLKSRPYIDLTLRVMREFGLPTPRNDHYEKFYFEGKQSGKKAEQHSRTYTVEGDWSGGAFLLVAGAIGGKITVKGLDVRSTQADKAILKALEDCGAYLKIDNEQIIIGPGSLRAFTFDATDCPDLFPPLVALAAYCQGDSTISGANRLTHKESNRAQTLKEEFGKLGLQIEVEGDVMRVHGGKGLRGSTVHSRHDHRIAMACAVAAIGAKGQVTIHEAQAVNKSYPGFYSDLIKLGVKTEIDSFIHDTK